MMLWRSALMLLLFVLAAGRCVGEAVNLSGTWRLNVKKSTWSAMRRPEMVILQIDHREPALKFFGTVEHPNEETRHFAFDGAIDGKQYPAQRSFGQGTVTLKRVNDQTVLSTFRSQDGKFVEATEIVVARDGRSLRQHIRLTTPTGQRKWTEAYEKRTGK